MMHVDLFYCSYYKLVEEMREAQERKEKNAEWISWHEGCHLVTKGPEASPTYKSLLQQLTAYFNLRNGSQGTRFNWYRDGKDWKPFHHDSAAFNPQRARNQNITVGISFGSEREVCVQTVSKCIRPLSTPSLLSFVPSACVCSYAWCGNLLHKARFSQR